MAMAAGDAKAKVEVDMPEAVLARLETELARVEVERT